MLLGIINNKNNSFEYIELINNCICCKHLDQYGFHPSNTEYIDKLIQKLRLHKDCTYIKKIGNYDLFYDEENNLKHFIRDGKENFNLFYFLNGQDEILYKKNKGIKKNLLRSFTIYGCTIILELSFFSFAFSQNVNVNEDKYRISFVDEISQVTNYEEVSSKSRYPITTVEDAVGYIKNSEIDENLKEFLLNEKLLYDTFSYYSETSLEYCADLKFKNIHIEFYDRKSDIEEGVDSNIVGYYKLVDPNILHITDEFEKENIETNEDFRGVVSHEYVHLMQNHANPYKYLLEACAELVSKEYYNVPIDSYHQGVKNLMLLIDIIGPKPIMELMFGGKITEFEDILKNNLKENEYKEICFYFMNKELLYDHEEENSHIREILCHLYKKIYNEDIIQNEDIQFDYLYNNCSYDCFQYDKYYLNVHKMADYDDIDGKKIMGIKNRFLDQYKYMIKQYQAKYKILM